MFCPQCGNALGNLDQRCTSCGGAISSSPASEAVPENPTSTNAPLIVGIALALLAVILIIGFLVFSGGGESDSSAVAATAKATTSVPPPPVTEPPPPPVTEPPPPPVTEPPPIQLDPQGLGPLRLGMSQGDALATGLIGNLRPGCEIAGNGQEYGDLLPPLEGLVVFWDGGLVLVSLGFGASTAQGATPGTPLAVVSDAFARAGFSVRIDTSYEKMFEIWLGTVENNGEQVFTLVIDPESELVNSIDVPDTLFCE
jgi:hypothetical protein